MLARLRGSQPHRHPPHRLAPVWWNAGNGCVRPALRQQPIKQQAVGSYSPVNNHPGFRQWFCTTIVGTSCALTVAIHAVQWLGPRWQRWRLRQYRLRTKWETENAGGDVVLILTVVSLPPFELAATPNSAVEEWLRQRDEHREPCGD